MELHKKVFEQRQNKRVGSDEPNTIMPNLRSLHYCELSAANWRAGNVREKLYMQLRSEKEGLQLKRNRSCKQRDRKLGPPGSVLRPKSEDLKFGKACRQNPQDNRKINKGNTSLERNLRICKELAGAHKFSHDVASVLTT